MVTHGVSIQEHISSGACADKVENMIQHYIHNYKVLILFNLFLTMTINWMCIYPFVIVIVFIVLCFLCVSLSLKKKTVDHFYKNSNLQCKGHETHFKYL